MAAISVQRVRTLVVFCAFLTGCALEAPDGIDDIGVVPGGKADGSDFSACELDAVVAFLNEGPSVADLRGGGVHTRAARWSVRRADAAPFEHGPAARPSRATASGCQGVARRAKPSTLASPSA